MARRTLLCFPSAALISTLQIFKERQPINDRTGRHTACADQFKRNGGGERDRTDDPLLAKQVLSQLSYTPMVTYGGSGWIRTNDPRLIKTML